MTGSPLQRAYTWLEPDEGRLSCPVLRGGSVSNDPLSLYYLQLQPISQKMANDLRRWASSPLKARRNNKLALKCLMDELVCRGD